MGRSQRQRGHCSSSGTGHTESMHHQQPQRCQWPWPAWAGHQTAHWEQPRGQLHGQ